MSKTRTQLIARVLSRLGAIQAGETPSAEDSDIVDDELEPVVADLAARGVAVISDLDEIDDEVFPHLSRIVANELAPDFGKIGSEADRLELKALAAERSLRIQTRTRFDAGPPRVLYY
jgi:hypothetical protein